MKLSARKDLDLKDLDFINKESAEEILAKIIAGKPVTLVPKLSARDESLNKMDRKLNKLFRQVRTIDEETGTYDLCIGYPFVEGRFLDESIARCPLLLFPVKLERNFERSPRWKLVAYEGEEVSFNPTFFLAYEKFQQVRLKKDFWEQPIESFRSIQDLLNWLYQFLKENEIEINLNQELFQFQIKPFQNHNKDSLESKGIGELKCQPYAVLGIFPQSDSALLQDYETLEDSHSFQGADIFSSLDQKILSDKRIREEERYFVTPVDQSQEAALIKVKQGKSVVVHGPPGTGKSQLILNLIADGMATGKKILLVSQKRAALDVVYHRLANVGLDQYTALIHDYSHDRSKIFRHIGRLIDQIDQFKKDNLNLNVTKWEHDYRVDSRRIDELGNYFEQLYQALTVIRPCGLSVHDLYLSADSRLTIMPVKEVSGLLDYESLGRFSSKLQEISDFHEFLSTDYPWIRRKSLASLGLSEKQDLIRKCQLIPGEVQKLSGVLDQLKQILPNLEFSETSQNLGVLQKINSWSSFLENERAKDDLINLLSGKPKFGESRKILDKYEKLIERHLNIRFLERFSWRLVNDLEIHLVNYRKHYKKAFRLFSLPFLKARWYLNKILEPFKVKISESALKSLETECKTIQDIVKLYESTGKVEFFADFPLTEGPQKQQEWLRHKTSVRTFQKELRAEKELKKILPAVKQGAFNQQKWNLTVGFRDLLNTYNDLLTRLQSRWKEFLAEDQIRNLLNSQGKPNSASWFPNALSTCIERDFDDLKALDLLLESLNSKELQVFERIQDKLENTGPNEFLKRIKEIHNSFIIAWIEHAEQIDPELPEVSGRSFYRRREEYSSLILERQKKVVELIHRQLKESIVGAIKYNRLGNAVTYRDLRHQVTKKRRIWPVRKLVSTFWEEGLNLLLPVWMGSPESVSAIFPMQENYFDLVIFDEASQCYVERALPPLLRGKTAVIAGDEKQLAPFDLYNVKIDEEEDGFLENEMAVEVESILDLAKNTLTEARLEWHYRSETETLINFSNYAFYNGRLKLIPEPQQSPQYDPRIEWIQTEGSWSKNTNQAEAECVVKLIESWLEAKEIPTIGVVTFNYHQQELIKDEIDQRMQELVRQSDDEMVAKWREILNKRESEENLGLFIKNIENVQGDEREVIIFSIAYAKNSKGKLNTHFGSLSQKGGENRLNVAITRAKKKIQIVCSFEPSELNVEESIHQGPRLFKDYLTYAKMIHDGKHSQATDFLTAKFDHTTATTLTSSISSSLAQKLAERLEKEGFQVLRNIGDTNYKIDLVIVKADEPTKFLLAIECEGENYFSGKSSKEREVYRSRLLAQKGWKHTRVWARNFYLNPEKELKRLIKLADQSI